MNVTTVFKVRGGVGKRALRAVDNVSLTIGASETVAVVGESGSGKTTFGRVVLDLLKPTSGRVEYDGVDVAAMDKKQWRRFRREVQVVFQDTGSSLNPRRSIGGSLELPLRYNLGIRGEKARKRTAQLLDMVGLSSSTFASRSPLELSGGQRQRVSIARAMASNPRLIVADEAVSALDVSVRAQVLQVMKSLQEKEGVSFLFITHDLGVVRAVSDRVVVLYLGHVMEQGSAAAVLGNPSHPYTKALLAAAPRPDPGAREQIRVGLKGDIPSPIAPPPGCRFNTRCPLAQDICRTTVPTLRVFDDGVESSCHFADEVRAANTRTAAVDGLAPAP